MQLSSQPEEILGDENGWTIILVVFILSHGRAGNVKTYQTLINQGFIQVRYTS